MITRIELRDFMAHSHSVIELGAGLTVLTGPNNTGKSAVVEALRCLTQNSPLKQHIRHGAKEARVAVWLEDGTRVEWIRNRKYSAYELWAPGAKEAKSFYKFGRSVPDEIQAVLRLDQVLLEERQEAVDVHLGNQRYPIFLLDSPGSAMAEFFAASTEGVYLLKMQDKLRDKTKEAGRARNENHLRREELEQALSRLGELPRLELLSQRAAELLEAAKGVERELPHLVRCRQELLRLGAEDGRLRKQGAVLQALRAAPKLEPVAELLWCASELVGLRLARQRERGQRSVLQGLQLPPRLFGTAALESLSRRLRSGHATAQSLRQCRRELAPLTPPPPLFPAPALAALLLAQLRLRAERSRARRRQATLAPLAAAPQLAPLRPLTALLERRAALQRQARTLRLQAACAAPLVAPPPLAPLISLQERLQALQRLRSDQTALRQTLEQQRLELEAFRAKAASRIAALGLCPLCGGALDPEQVLEKGHRHA